MADSTAVQSIVADPRFDQLSVTDQQSLLGKADPRFLGISQGEVSQIVNGIKTRAPSSPVQMGNQALAASGIPGGAAPPAAPPPMQMQESMAPKIVRGAGAVLPAIGATAGGIFAAPAGGVGAVAGGAVGGMLGEEARQSINQGMSVPGGKYGDQPLSPQESAKQIGLAGALGAASEVPGALLIGPGSKVLARTAASQAAKETGSAATALAENAPIGFSAKGLLRSLNSAFDNISSKVSTALQGSQGTTSLSQTMAPAVQRAAQSQVSGVATRLNKIITAAKEVAGIQGDQVTADQMFSFGQQLARPNVYSGNPGPIKAVLDSYLKEMYGHAGNAVRSLAPEADLPLQQLTNIHAARTAVKAYSPGTVGSTLITAATHPRTTAALSPALSVLGASAPQSLKDRAKAIGIELMP